MKLKELPSEGPYGSGATSCAGCMASNIALNIMKILGKKTIVSVPPSCMSVFGGTFPNLNWDVPYFHLQFGNLASTLAGISRALKIQGRAWVIKIDNIDTDMIFHNRYLSITKIEEMGQYTFDNLKGYENFSKQVKKGDIVVTGKNFGCGSSRQQAVDCFKSLGVGLIIAESFGAIYERNAINNAMPIMISENITKNINDKDYLIVDFSKGEIINKTQEKTIRDKPFSKVQLEIYERGGLLEG